MTEYYEDSFDAMNGPMEPKTPCRIMETRACSVIVPDAQTIANAFRYRVDPCPPGMCARFPNRDKRS